MSFQCVQEKIPSVMSVPVNYPMPRIVVQPWGKMARPVHKRLSPYHPSVHDHIQTAFWEWPLACANPVNCTQGCFGECQLVQVTLEHAISLTVRWTCHSTRRIINTDIVSNQEFRCKNSVGLESYNDVRNSP